MNLNEKMRWLWKRSGKTQEWFANLVGIDRTTMTRRLAGKFKRTWTAAEVEVILRAFNLDLALFWSADTEAELEALWAGQIDVSRYTDNLPNFFEAIYETYAKRLDDEHKPLFRFQIDQMKEFLEKYDKYRKKKSSFPESIQ